nr:nucleotide exchange factor GrpE [Salsipaludibacter albus]
MAGHLEQVLGRLGVAPIRVRPGTAFDSTVHRAVGTDGVGDAAHGPTIQRLVRPGWQGPDGVLRQPEVVVSTPPDTGRRDGP